MGVKIVLNPLQGNKLLLDINGQVKNSNITIQSDLKLKKTNLGTEFWVVPEGLLSVVNSLVEYPVVVEEQAKSENYILVKDKSNQVYRLYPFEGLKVEKVNLTKSQEKETHKVYETPDEVFSLVAQIIPKAYFERVKEIVKERIEGNLLSVVKDKTYAREILDEFKRSPEKLLAKLKNILSEKDYLKVERELSRYDLFLKTLEKEDYSKAFEIAKAITNRDLKDFTKEQFKIPLFDPQAGSGRILNAFKKRGLSAILFGTEIRNLKPKDPNNKVLYGVDFNIAYKFLKEEFNNSKTFQSQIAYLNPPYRSNMEEERKSLQLLPSGMPVVGLFSHKALKLLSANIEGLLIELPVGATGYTEENNPSKFVLVIGVKNNSLSKRQKIVSAKSLDEVPKLIDENGEVLRNFFNEVFERVQFANRYNASVAGLNYSYIERQYKGIKQKYENTLKQFEKLSQLNPERIINNPTISLKESLLAGVKVFPDLRLVGSNRKYSLFEVLSNPVLLKTYEQFVPNLYKFILKLAKEKGLPVAVNEESPYVTTENLGLTKYKHFPKVFPADLILKFVEENAYDLGFKEEDLQTLRELLKSAKVVGVKARPTLSTMGGEVAFGYTPVLVAIDKEGRDIGLIDVNLSKFFKKLEETGIVKPKYKLAEPDGELKETILQSYIENIDYVKRALGIDETGEEFQKFRKIYLKLEGLPSKVLKLLRKEIKKEEIVSAFNEVARLLSVDNEKVYNERVKKFLNSQSPQEVIYTFKNLYGYLYAKLFEELLKSEQGKGLKEKIQNEILKLANVEEEIKGAVLNSLKAEGREGEFSKIEPTLNELIKEFKERPFVFSYLQERDDIERYLNDPSVEESKKESLKQLPIYPEGSKAYLTRRLGDKSLAESFLSGASAYVSLEDKLRNSIRRLFIQLFEVEILRTLDTAKAFERFEKLFINKLGIKPHQFYEALRLTAKKKLDGTKGHLLGWEMRSGKTLTMFLSGYFAYLGHGIKETFIFPKTANISDILLQMVEFVPQLLPSVKSYQVSTVDIPLRENLVGEFLTTDIYPNLLAIPEVKRMLVGRGETQKKLGKSYVKEMEELIDGFREDKEKLEKAKEIIKSDKDLKSLLYTTLPEDVKVATAVYLKRLKEKGLLQVDQKNLQGLIDKLTKLGRKIREEVRLEEKSGDKPYRVHIVPKTTLDGVAYRIPIRQKVLRNDAFTFQLLNDINLEPSTSAPAEWEEYLEGWYFSRRREPTNMTLEYFERTFTQFVDWGLGEILRENLPPEKVEELGDIDELKGKLKLNIEYKPFLKIVEKNKNGEVSDLMEKGIFKFDIEGIEDGEVKELLKKAFEKYLLEVEEVLLPAREALEEILSFKKIKTKRGEKITNSLIELLKEGRRGVDIEFELLLEEIPAIPITFKKLNKDGELLGIEQLWYLPYAVDYSQDFIYGEKKKIDKINAHFKAQKNEFFFEVEAEEAPKPEEYPQSFSKAYFFHSKAFEERKYTAIVDEADEAINPDAQKYRAFLTLAKNSKLAIASTGTPTAGDVKTPVALLGLVSGMDIETIKQAMSNVEQNFTTYRFGGSNVLINAFLTIASNLMFDERRAEEFWRQIIVNTPYDFKELTESVEMTVNTMLKFNTDDKGNTINAEVEYELTKFLSSIEPQTVKGFFKFVNQIDRYLTATGKPFAQGLIEYLETSREKRVIPGTFDPIGFVSTLTGSVSFQTRENLKKLTDPSIEEKLVVKDLNNFHLAVYKRFEEMEVSKEFKNKTVWIDIPGKLAYPLEALEANKELIEKFNFIPQLRIANDVGLVKYLTQTKISLVKSVVNALLEGIEKYAKDKPEKLAGILGLELTPKQLQDTIFRSGVSVNDSVKEIIWEMIYNGYDFEKVEQLKASSTDKQNLLELKKEVAKEIWLFVGQLTETIFEKWAEGDKKGVLDFLKAYGLDKYVDIDLFFELASQKQDKEEETAVPRRVGFDGEKFYVNDEPLMFNFEIEFTNPDWNEMLLTPYAYRYNYRIAGGDNEEIVDVVNNKGYKEIYASLAKEGKSFLVAPSRVPTLAVSILDTITYLAKNKPEGKEYQVLIRITDKSIEEVLRHLDTAKLKKLGITVKSFKNHNLLDLEVKKFAKAVKKGELGMVVIAPAKTISRGVDLSMLDTIVIPGTVQGSGKDFAQLTARTFNNTDRHSTNIYLFGTPLRLSYYKVYNNEFINPALPYTSIVQARLLKKFEFIKSMMSGKLLNVLEIEGGRVIPLKELDKEKRLEEELREEFNYDVA